MFSEKGFANPDIIGNKGRRRNYHCCNRWSIKPSEYYRIKNLMRHTGESNGFWSVLKGCLPVVSIGSSHREDPSYGAMFVLSASELNIEEVKNLLNGEVSFRIRQQESIVQEATEALSALNQISTEVSGLDKITDLDNEEKEKDL